MSNRLRPREGFVALIPSLARDLGSVKAALILQLLHFKADDEGKVRITLDQIAEGLGCSKRSVQMHLAVLREDGLISAQRTSWSDAAKTYTLNYDHPILTPEEEVATEEVASNATCNVATPATSLLVVKKKKNPPTPQGGGEPIGFAEFWAKYPRKIGKQAAVKAYRAALKVASPEQIITALSQQVPELSNRQQQYIPHPSSWLNAGRWEDELPEPEDTRTEYDRIRDQEREWELSWAKQAQ